MGGTMPEEQWLPVVGYEGLYEVSDQGRVRNALTLYVLVSVQHGTGYAIVSLRKNLKTVTPRVHRLVLEAFVGPCPKGSVTNHINGVRMDNRLENLEWCTQRANIRHKFDVLGCCAKGEKNNSSILTESDVHAIRERLRLGHSKGHIAKDYGLTWGAIHAIAVRRNWSHI